MKRVLHGLVLLAIVLALFAAPYRAFIGPIRLGSLFGGGVDAVSSASVILDAPSGSYVVLLNEARHQRYDTSDQWERFFKGESLVIMDDVVCGVMEADAGGRLMAVDPADAEALLAELEGAVPAAQRIGTVEPYRGGKRIFLH